MTGKIIDEISWPFEVMSTSYDDSARVGCAAPDRMLRSCLLIQNKMQTY